ncbi:hypothetical protein L6452_30168 [Arctium lappa]|uniref:Uncharacterized protein n=1 Tax=Arctium lappa TaxID=4217 RepID=A0ACB8ZI28_ARCLA|nr:hypothetical protein L6452_30168 [Arctium lappa]
MLLFHLLCILKKNSVIWFQPLFQVSNSTLSFPLYSFLLRHQNQMTSFAVTGLASRSRRFPRRRRCSSSRRRRRCSSSSTSSGVVVLNFPIMLSKKPNIP